MIYRDPVRDGQPLPDLPLNGIWIRRGDYWWAESTHDHTARELQSLIEESNVRPISVALEGVKDWTPRPEQLPTPYCGHCFEK